MLTACAEWMEKDVERWTTESGLNLPSLCVPVLCDKWSFQKDYTTLHGPLGYHEEYNHMNTGGFRAYFNKHAINAKTSAQKWHVFHFHTWEIPRCYRFYSPHPDERDIALCDWACFDLITAVWSASCWIREVSEEKDAPQPVLGRVASLREKKTHNAILIGA